MALLSAITFPRDLADELHRRMASGSWALFESQDTNPGIQSLTAQARESFVEVRPLPSVKHVAELLDVGYVASLMEEEGRRIECAYGYLSPQGAAALRFGTFRFASPLAFRPETIARMAPAAQLGRTEFGVWEERGELFIWGLIHHGDQTFAIDLEHKPSYFSARILRPGTLTVHFDEHLLLLFSRDQGHFFDHGLDLFRALRDRVATKPRVAAALCRLGRRMLALGHGGTLLVVDKEATHAGLVWHPALTPSTRPDALLAEAVLLDERATLGELRLEGEPVAQYVARRMRVEKVHNEALDFVAHLTAVDGAVVLDNQLGLLGAGATIQTPDSAMPLEVVVEDPRQRGEESRATLSSLGGNRHTSAVCFCAQQPTFALALVASQDGDLSFFARRNDGLVHALRPFELGVGV